MSDNKDKLWALDYRHYICSAITLLFLGCGFLFPNALPRLALCVMHRRVRFYPSSTKKKRPEGRFFLERMTGIEPAYLAWEASTLPLSYIRVRLF